MTGERAELVIEPARPDTDTHTIRHARCSLCPWSMKSTSREDIKARFVEHARDRHRPPPTVVLTHSGPGPLPKEMAERIAKAVNPSMTGEHRNGCEGCESRSDTYPRCWTVEEVVADRERIKRVVERGVDIPMSCHCSGRCVGASCSCVCHNANDATRDTPYWKQLAEQWHKHYLDALDERDAARLQRDALQSGATEANARVHSKSAPSIPWLTEGHDPRAWFSPTDGYFVYWASSAGEMLMIRAWDSQRVDTLPDDAYEIGSYPTRYAYEQACTALAQHRERADNLEGRHKALRDKIMPVIGGDWTIGPPPLEVAVDCLIHLVQMARIALDDNERGKK